MLNRPLGWLGAFAHMKTAVALSIALMTLQAVAQGDGAGQARTVSQETYESVDLDGAGNLRIVTSDQRTIVVPKGGPPNADQSLGGQTAFENAVVSEDRRAVAVRAMFRNCCASYDVPLQLVIYSGGTTHRLGNGLAIFDSHFVDGGRRVAFSEQTVHFACSVHWELRDVASENLVAAVDIPEPCGQIPNPPQVTVPTWVTGAVSGIR